MLIAINFHYIREEFAEPYPGIHGVLPDEFERQLDILGRLGIFVEGNEIAEAIAGGRPLPKRSIVITFDDGLREQFNFAWPILKRKGIPAIFFINTATLVNHRPSRVHLMHYVRAHTAPKVLGSMVGTYFQAHGIEVPSDLEMKAAAQYRYDPPDIRKIKYMINMVMTDIQQQELLTGCIDVPIDSFALSLYMTPEQIRELGDAGAIGAHSHEHVPLANLDDRQLQRQFECSEDAFQRIGLTDIRAFSYPYGSPTACSQRVAAVARQFGFVYAFTMERAANHNLDYPMFLARYAQNDVPGGKSDNFVARDLFDTASASHWFR